MPEASTPKQSGTESRPTSKAGFSKSKTPKAILDIIFFMDRDHLDLVGVERTLSGLKRTLPVEKCQLHLVHFSQKPFQMPDKILSHVHEHLKNAEFPIVEERFCPLTSEIVSEFIHELRESNYDLLVFCIPELPNGHHSAYAHLVQHMASHVPLSVLIWRKPLAEPPHPLKVIFGVDGSESSLNAVTKSATLLNLKFAHLNAVTVLSPVFQDNAVTAPFVNPDVLEQALDANANMIFEMANGILTAQGLPKPAHKKLIGSPATELGYWMETENPDLMIVGSHNRKGFLAWLMGSVSSQLLQWDRHNLLVVR